MRERSESARENIIIIIIIIPVSIIPARNISRLRVYVPFEGVCPITGRGAFALSVAAFYAQLIHSKLLDVTCPKFGHHSMMM